MKIMSETELKKILNKLGEEVLESKIQRMRNLLKIALPDEALYREMMLSLGYPKNKVQFLELALLLPYREIQMLKTQSLVERALLYRAGFSDDIAGLPESFDVSLKLDKSYWVIQSIRPANFPERRIKDFSHLLSETVSTGIYNYFKRQIENNCMNFVDSSTAKRVVQKIMSFKGIGISRKREIFFNIILPFFLADDTFVEYHHFLNKVFETHPPLDENSKIKKFYDLTLSNQINIKIVLANVREYMGAMKYVNG